MVAQVAQVAPWLVATFLATRQSPQDDWQLTDNEKGTHDLFMAELRSNELQTPFEQVHFW